MGGGGGGSQEPSRFGVSTVHVLLKPPNHDFPCTEACSMQSVMGISALENCMLHRKK